jgi:hypothetical protein
MWKGKPACHCPQGTLMRRLLAILFCVVLAALATIGLTAATHGTHYASLEARSMIVGALAFFCFTTCVTRRLLRHKIEAGRATLYSLPMWFVVAFAIRYACFA